MKKKWIISAGVALALGALATVAIAERRENMREHRQPTLRMLEQLDLTDEQKEQLEAIREQHEAIREQHEAMREQHEAIRETMRETLHEQYEALREQREAMLNILTDEQKEAMQEMRGKRGKFFGRRGWAGKMSPGATPRLPKHALHDRHRRGGQGAFARLDLTDEQKEQLAELRKKQRTELRETRQKHRQALEGVLTDEQREKLAEMKDAAFYGGGKRWRGKR